MENIEVLRKIFGACNENELQEKYEIIKNTIDTVVNYKVEIKETNKQITDTINFTIDERLKITDKNEKKILTSFIKKVAKELLKKDETSNQLYLEFRKLFLNDENEEIK